MVWKNWKKIKNIGLVIFNGCYETKTYHEKIQILPKKYHLFVKCLVNCDLLLCFELNEFTHHSIYLANLLKKYIIAPRLFLEFEKNKNVVLFDEKDELEFFLDSIIKKKSKNSKT